MLKKFHYNFIDNNYVIILLYSLNQVDVYINEFCRVYYHQNLIIFSTKYVYNT